MIGTEVGMESRERESKLTPTEERLLGFFTARIVDGKPMKLTKQEMAIHLECCVRTVDRSVRTLRNAGYIEVVPKYDKAGGAIANEYKVLFPAN